MILVTGGAGFIGSVLVKELNYRGYSNIIIVDRLESDEKWKNLRKLDYIDYIHADILFEQSDDSFWENVEYIYHMGACSSTTENDVDYLWANNVLYSRELFNIAAEYNIPFVYASSAATYGDGELGYDDSHEKIRSLMPLNPYGFSKHIFDKWIFQQEKKPQKWFGLKFFNVFGPNEYHKGDMRSLVHKGFHQIQNDGQVKLFKSHRPDYKDGEQLRDFVYVKDVVKASISLGESKDEGISGIYNIGTGESRTFLDLIKATFVAMEKEENIVFVDMPENIRHQYQYYTQANMDKLKKALPFFQFMSLEAAVKDYVTQHLQVKDSYL